MSLDQKHSLFGGWCLKKNGRGPDMTVPAAPSEDLKSRGHAIIPARRTLSTSAPLSQLELKPPP
jgi:hypothetical protein